MIPLLSASRRTHGKPGPDGARAATPHVKNAGWRRLLLIWFAGIAALAAVTWCCFSLGLGESAAKCVFLTVVVLLSLTDGFISSILFCVVAILSIDYFFTKPLFRLQIPTSMYLMDLATFLIASLVVTTLVRHTRALARAQREQARLLDLTHDTIVVHDPAGRITYWNRGAERLYGWSKPEALGRDIDELLLTRFPQSPDQIAATLVETGHWEGELLRKTRHGTDLVIASRWSLQRTQQGAPLAVLESGNDITARTRAEDALRQSEATYVAEAQRLSDTGSFGWEVASGRVFWSEQSFSIFGYPLHIEPTLAVVMQRVHPDDSEFVRQTIGTAAAGRQPFDFEHRLLMPDGTIKYLHVVGHATDGEQLHYAGAIMDITTARRTEQRLQDAQAELARVTRVTMLGELSTSIAHEVGQPIAATVTNAEASLRWLERDPPRLDEVRAGLTRIIGEARRSFQIVSRVRTLATKDTGLKTLLDVDDVVKEVLVLIQREILRHEATLRLQLAGSLPLVMADRIQLQQVLINLIINGLQAMDGVTGRPRELVIATRTGAGPDAPVVIAVRDNGAGIAPESRERLFNAFFTTKPQGMGMGLSICRSIVDAHRGTIRTLDNDGHGVTFECALPRASAAELAEHAATPQAS
jgi:PAS domain S-box-containing protein